MESKHSLSAEKQVSEKTFIPRRRQQPQRFFVAFRSHSVGRVEVAIDDTIRARAIERAKQLVAPVKGLIYEATD